MSQPIISSPDALHLLFYGFPLAPIINRAHWAFQSIQGGLRFSAMPYPDYARVLDKDIHALYVYFMDGVKPSAEVPPQTKLSFPYSQRWGLALWNMVFTAGKDWNSHIAHGAYLVEGLGHCSSCHTPRGLAMQEKALTSDDDDFLAGGDLNGWSVPSLRGSHWSEQDLVDYLSSGRNRHAAVAGEMTSVIANSTSYMSDSDLHDIAAYIKALGSDKQDNPHPDPNNTTTQKLMGAKDLSEVKGSVSIWTTVRLVTWSMVKVLNGYSHRWMVLQ